jgi:hypothetical protein
MINGIINQGCKATRPTHRRSIWRDPQWNNGVDLKVG